MKRFILTLEIQGPGFITEEILLASVTEALKTANERFPKMSGRVLNVIDLGPVETLVKHG